MATDAKVRSIDELEAFRSSMIVFQNRARKAIDQASDEVKRTRLWIETDRVPHYQALVKKLTQRLQQAEGELMSARMSEFIDNPTVQQQAVRKAKAALQDAEEKLKAVKHWSRSFETTVQPMVKKLESVTQFIDFDIPQAIIHMAQLIRTLDAYAERVPVLQKPTRNHGRGGRFIPVMSARVGAANLEEAVKELSVRWQVTRRYWRDEKAMEFERTYLAKLPQVVVRAKTIMEEMDQLLRKVRHDCE